MSLSPSRKPDGSDAGVGVVELDPHGAALVPDRHRLVEPTVLDAQLVELRSAVRAKKPELRVVPLALELGDHDDRQHDLVLGEAAQGAGIGQQDAGVEDVRAVLADLLVEPRSAYPSSDRRDAPHPVQFNSWTGRLLEVVRDSHSCLPIQQASPPADEAESTPGQRPNSGDTPERGMNAVLPRSAPASRLGARLGALRSRSGARARRTRGWRAGSRRGGSRASSASQK